MFKQIRKQEHGQALLEMALVLPIFLLLLFGVIEMGRIGHAYVTVNNAARVGARLATVGGSDLDVINAIYNAAPSLDKPKITVGIDPGEYSRRSGQNIKITVSYPVPLIVPIIQSIVPNPVNVKSTLNMRVE